jgi:hypothetical protein
MYTTGDLFQHYVYLVISLNLPKQLNSFQRNRDVDGGFRRL